VGIEYFTAIAQILDSYVTEAVVQAFLTVVLQSDITVNIQIVIGISCERAVNPYLNVILYT
jgi:hypothetical protein